MKLLVLAGGFGTRLKSVVSDVPKALAPIGDIPFLQLQLDNWINQGVDDFVFLLHHQSDQIIAFLKMQQTLWSKKCHIDWLVEPLPMDTGGAVAYAVKKLAIKGGFLTINADTWLGGGIGDMFKFDRPAIVVVNLSDVSRYGQVLFSEDRCVTAFEEKNGQSTSGWINAGLCHLTSDLFENWNGWPFSLERDLFVTLMKNRKLIAQPLETDFIDIGVPSDYHRFCHWIVSGREDALWI